MDDNSAEQLAGQNPRKRVFTLLQSLLPIVISMIAVTFGAFTVIDSVFSYLHPPPKIVLFYEQTRVQAEEYATEGLAEVRIAQEMLRNNPGDPEVTFKALDHLATVSGNLAGIQTFLTQGGTVAASTSLPSFVRSAEAATANTAVDAPPKFESMRQYVAYAMIGFITLILVFFILMYAFAANSEKIKFADSMIRMIVGFYIGVVTGLLGIPSA
ncbi:hypothetical protein ELG78_09185 [Rhizobium leguminosarum]|uniref:flagellar motor protein MotB n=1 Tax=Rhizobium leguminosarum TaxID=384 RepID=UPI0010327073|nr:flagellar motor protein MotB [Rhizobium leguminosarum]TBG37142.1 hypothetical protein ELG78_09185 [Rhizobium leguminosarum]